MQKLPLKSWQHLNLKLISALQEKLSSRLDENEKEKQRLIQLIEDLETKLRDRDRENRDRESEIRKKEFELESEKRKFETEKEIVFARLDDVREKLKVILGSGGTLRNII